MQRYIQFCGAIVWLLGTAAFLMAQEDKPAEKPAAAVATVSEGELHLGEKTIKLLQIVAYESKLNDDTMINVLLSDRRLPAKQIQAALTEGDGSDDSLSLSQRI